MLSPSLVDEDCGIAFPALFSTRETMKSLVYQDRSEENTSTYFFSFVVIWVFLYHEKEPVMGENEKTERIQTLALCFSLLLWGR